MTMICVGCGLLAVGLVALGWACAPMLQAAENSPPLGKNIHLRGSLSNARLQFERVKTGHVAFIGGSQIDKFGNINSTGVGSWSNPGTFTYFAGSGGANDMATSGKRVLAIMPQDPKKFVEKLDYLTSPGYLTGPGARERLGMIGGGPSVVVSTMAVYRFDDLTKEMVLAEYFPGYSIEKVRANCSFDLKVAPEVKETEPPTEGEIALLRNIDPTGFYLR